MNICFNSEASRFVDTSGYFKLVCDKLGLPSFINTTEDNVEADVVFNVESCHHFIRGKDLTLIYHADPTWNHANNISSRINECDLIFCTHMDVPYKDDPKFRYLPHASYGPWHKEVEKQYDIFLPPSPQGRQDRQELSDKLTTMFNTHTVEYGTPTHKYIEEMQKCRIVFNLSGRGDMNRKIYDGMLHGVLLTNELKELPLAGTKGKHYFTYKDDPIPMLTNLLKDPETLARVDKASTKHVLENHTYKDRMFTLLEEMYNELDQRK